MVYVEYNPNPAGRRVGDCAVRAVAKALDVDWERAYSLITANGFLMNDMPSSDSVWGSVLRQRGFFRQAIPNTCPDCYTAADFCRDNPYGTYVLGFGGHVATVVDGDLYDSWDSSQEIPMYVWYRKDLDVLLTANSEQWNYPRKGRNSSAQLSRSAWKLSDV